MIIMVVCFVLWVICILTLNFNWWWDGEDFTAIVLIIFSIILIMCIVSFPLTNYGTNKFIVVFYSVEKTLENARLKGESFENVMLQSKIIEINKELAARQYANTTMFGIWIPDKIMDLKPIK